MPTLTTHVTQEFIDSVDAMAKQLDRSRAWVIREAVRSYLLNMEVGNNESRPGGTNYEPIE